MPARYLPLIVFAVLTTAILAGISVGNASRYFVSSLTSDVANTFFSAWPDGGDWCSRTRLIGSARGARERSASCIRTAPFQSVVSA
jgi:hypothetical protein